jgi:hypothetical protein
MQTLFSEKFELLRVILTIYLSKCQIEHFQLRYDTSLNCYELEICNILRYDTRWKKAITPSLIFNLVRYDKFFAIILSSFLKNTNNKG